jgi:hypothetical protein
VYHPNTIEQLEAIFVIPFVSAAKPLLHRRRKAAVAS